MANYSGKPVWENRKHVLLEKENNESIYLVLIMLALGLILFSFLLLLLILPILISIIGFFVNISKRFWIGICAILSFIYLWYDSQKEWIAYITIYGNKQVDSWFENGLFSGKIQEFANYIFFVNVVGVLLGVFFIIQSYRFYKTA